MKAVIFILIILLTGGCAADNSVKEKTVVETTNIAQEIVIQEKEEEMKFPFYDIPMSYELQEYTFELCQEYDIAYELALGVIYVESRFKPDAKGASSIGLMQLNKNTYPWIAGELEINNFDPYNAKQNIHAGIYYLDYLRGYWIDKGYTDESAFSLMLISYNMGVSNCSKYVSKHGLDYGYVDKVYEYKTHLEQSI